MACDLFDDFEKNYSNFIPFYVVSCFVAGFLFWP